MTTGLVGLPQFGESGTVTPEGHVSVPSFPWHTLTFSEPAYTVLISVLTACSTGLLPPVVVTSDGSLPHEPASRCAQLAAVCAPSRAACVIMLSTMNAYPNCTAPMV